MNRQLWGFFTELSCAPGRHRSYEELAEERGVSTRTIRNYTAALLESLREINLTHVVQQSERGLIYTGVPEQTAHILREISGSGFYDYHLSPEERQLTIELLLLGSDEPLTITRLSDQLYVSRNTILGDIERTRRFFRERGVSFDERLNRGYRLELGEEERRETIFSVCAPYIGAWHDQSGRFNIFDRQVNSAFALDELLPQAEEMVKVVETAFSLSVSDKVYQHTVFSIAILTRRYLEGKFLPACKKLHPMKGASVYHIAEQFLEEWKKHNDLPCPPQEAEYLAARLCSCHFDAPESVESSRDIYLHLILYRFLQEMERELGCVLTEDQQLLLMLTQHIRSMEPPGLSDAMVGLAVSDLAKSYPQRYAAVKRHTGPLEEYVGHFFSEEELVLILVHILAAAERGLTGSARPRVVVVCHVGVGTGYFLADNLRDIFNLEIVGVTSSHKLSSLLEQERCDLVISTVDLTGEECRWLKVSPTLEDQDAAQLQRVLAELRKEKRDTLDQRRTAAHTAEKPEVKRLVPDSVLLDVPCADWREAIEQAAAPLVESGAVREGYVKAIFRSVELNGPYFVFAPGVALAHAAPSDGVERFCCSFLRLHRPVCFGHAGNDPVRFVVIVGITDADAQIGSMGAFMNLLYNEKNLRRLAKADEQGVRELLRQ